MTLRLEEHPEGVEVGAAGNHVVYDLDREQAFFGEARVQGPALVWEVEDPGPGDWVVRCDRIDFPPGGIAYRHVHPGPGIRRLLFGELTIESPDGTHTYREGDAWTEGADFPVLATASTTEKTAFVRVLVLPAEWAGKRTIRYVDPADDEKPRLQRATVLLEVPLAR